MKKATTNNRNRPRSNAQNKIPSCYFTQSKSIPDYKEVLILKRYVSDKGKIIPSSRSGITSKNQRILAQAIKRARYMALLPYTDKHSL